MITCKTAREQIALDPNAVDQELDAHVSDCCECTAYRRSHRTIDTVLRAELHWEAPPALTAQLLALAAPALPAFSASVANVAIERSRPNRWYVTLVYVLTIAVVALSLAVAWQLFSVIASQLGIGDALTELLALPGRMLQELAKTLPQSRFVIDFFLRARDQLMWLLLAAVLWAALDKWTPQINFGRRQLHS